MLIPSGYLPTCHQTPGFLALSLRALTRTFRDIEPTPQDKIVITFEPVTDPAIVNTVEVIDQRG